MDKSYIIVFLVKYFSIVCIAAMFVTTGLFVIKRTMVHFWYALLAMSCVYLVQFLGVMLGLEYGL